LNISDLVGFASDGASVMTGVHNGVAACLKKKVPRLVTSHCAALRLSLAAQDAESAFEEIRMSAVSSAYKYFSKSHPRQVKLATAIEMYETKKLRLVNASFTRWLSRGRCLSSAFDLFRPIKDVLFEDQDTAKAYKLFNDFFGNNGFYYWLAFMADVLSIVNELSAQLQAKELHVTLVPAIVAAQVANLTTSFVSNAGVGKIQTPRLKTLPDMLGGLVNITDDMSILPVHDACVEYVQRLINCINIRFPSATSEIFSKFACLYPEHLVIAHDLATHGNEAFAALCDIYIDPSVKVDSCSRYGSYKQFVVQNHSKMTSAYFLSFASNNTHLKTAYPVMIKLLKIAATLAAGSVDCERAFSLQNTIKTEHRSLLTIEHLQDLMICSRDGPDLKELNVGRILRLWGGLKKRKFVEVEHA
jgi:hypothetical protein